MARMEALYKEIDLLVRLKDIGIKDDRLEEMVCRHAAYSVIGHFNDLDMKDVVEIYKLTI